MWLQTWTRQLRQVQAALRSRSFASKAHVAAATPTLVETTVDWSGLPPVRLRGRRYLVGSDSPGVPEFLRPPRKGYPPVYVPAGHGEFSPEDWAVTARDVVRNVVDGETGAVLFRGLPLHTATDFSRFVDNAGLKPMSYGGGTALRTNVTGHVDTASIEHPSISMETHNEMSYTHPCPEKIIFYCLEPAQPGNGGESVMVDVREILRKLDPSVVDKFRSLGIRYFRHMPESSEAFHGFNSWKDVFRTDSRDDVEKYLTSRGMTWRWAEDGALSWWYNKPALTLYKGEWLWFNQANALNADYITSHPEYSSARRTPAHLSPFHTYYGDGSDIEPEVLQHIRDVTWQVAVGFQMKSRDVLVLNNMYIQHGRLGFTGERRLLVYLAESNA
ncbi:dapdiamide synthesis protein DdaC-like [Branchiostoma lanceolatum]|uniref:dapdiamide synthesis protein DdaC-like n=1 Tax=Branchiostoma lanceolatum TaxID=7740 RepID=UPI0034558103